MKSAALTLLLLAAPALAAPPKMDGPTRAWWATTSFLSSDAMQGRDTGSPGHAAAVAHVVERFRAARLQPAGEAGGFTQRVALREVKVEPAGTSFAILPPGAAPQQLRFLHEISVRPDAALPPSLEAGMRFGGYCSPAELGDVRGKIAVCFGNRRAGLPMAGERLAAATAAGAVGLLNVDDMGFTVEPPRWPEAYARSLRAADAPLPPATIPLMRLSAASFEALIAGSGHLGAALLTDGGKGRPLPAFDLPARLSARFTTSQRELAGDNVLALLPGTDPKRAAEVVVLSAHLDGYGEGEAVKGDSLYNGTFDDAAYVATLIQVAEARRGKGFARPVLFAVFTGEEKGLLGARAFLRAPTVPRASLAANINLDGIRPLFPLRSLTMLGMEDSSLATTVQAVGASLKISIHGDREPERGMNRRTDHWPFLEAGIPATAFMFGFVPRSQDEAIYRNWVNTRYHRPQDDADQPFDGTAARDFNRFAAKLVEAVAQAPDAPRMTPPPPGR